MTLQLLGYTNPEGRTYISENSLQNRPNLRLKVLPAIYTWQRKEGIVQRLKDLYAEISEQERRANESGLVLVKEGEKRLDTVMRDLCRELLKRGSTKHDATGVPYGSFLVRHHDALVQSLLSHPFDNTQDHRYLEINFGLVLAHDLSPAATMSCLNILVQDDQIPSGAKIDEKISDQTSMSRSLIVIPRDYPIDIAQEIVRVVYAALAGVQEDIALSEITCAKPDLGKLEDTSEAFFELLTVPLIQALLDAVKSQ